MHLFKHLATQKLSTCDNIASLRINKITGLPQILCDATMGSELYNKDYNLKQKDIVFSSTHLFVGHELHSLDVRREGLLRQALFVNVGSYKRGGFLDYRARHTHLQEI